MSVRASGDGPASWRSRQGAVWAIAWPMMAANVSVPLMGATGTAIMGHLDDPRYLAGVGLAANFFAFFYFVFAFLRWSTAGLTAQAEGRATQGGSGAERDLILLRSIGLALAFGLLVVLLRKPLIGVALDFMGATGAVRAEAQSYCEWRVLSAPALLGTYALAGWFIGGGRTRQVLVMTLVANLANVGLLAVLVPGLGLRADGAGLATAVAETIAFLVGITIVAVRRPIRLRAVSLSLLVDRQGIAGLFALNANVLIKTLFTAAVFYYFLRVSAGFDATTLAANLILLQLFYLASYVIDAFANACEALAGRADGAGDKRGALDALGACTLSAVGVGLAFAVLYAVAGGGLIRLLSSLPDVLAGAGDYVGWLVVLPPIMGLAFVMEGFFVGTLRARPLRDAALIAGLGFFLACALLVDRLGNHGLWLAMVGYFLVRPLAGFLLWRREGPGRGRAAGR